MGCGVCCCKCLLILVNIAVGIVGAVVLAVGVWAKTSAGDTIVPLLEGALSAIPGLSGSFNLGNAASVPSGGLSLDFGKILDNVAICLIVIGAILLGLAILGGIGACCKIRLLLYIYAALVLLLFLIQLLLVILFFAGALDSYVKGELKKIIKNEYGGVDAYDTYSLAWNVMMMQLKCCGVDNYMDFTGATKWKNTRGFTVGGVTVQKTLITPIPCCKFNTGYTPINNLCAQVPTDVTNNWKLGCYQALLNEVDNEKTIVIGAAAGVLGIQLLCAIGAILIGRQIEKDD